MAFLAYMTLLGLHQCLKAQLIAAFIRDIFYKVSVFFIIAFWTFSYTLQGVFYHFIDLALFTYVKKHNFIIFIFHGRIFNIFHIGRTWAFIFSQQHLKWLEGILHSAKHRDNRPEWFRHTIQLTKGKFCHQLRAETQHKHGGFPTKVLAGKGPPCHKSSSKSG